MRKRSKAPWFKRNPVFFEKLKADVAACYPNLHFSVRENQVFLTGSFPIEHEGQIIDHYAIEIEFPQTYPKGIPLVREVGGRIPRTPDRHIYATEDVCLFLPLEVSSAYPEGTSLLAFLNGPVQSFFVGQSIFELTGEWPFGQRSHGDEGYAEYVTEVTGVKDKDAIYRFILAMQKDEIKGYWDCPCGSGKKLRNCHLQQVLKLHRDYQYYLRQYAWINNRYADQK